MKEPCLETFCLILHCDHYFSLYKDFNTKNGNGDLIKSLVENVDVGKIVKHFFKVRSFCKKNFSENCEKRGIVYGTATSKM